MIEPVALTPPQIAKRWRTKPETVIRLLQAGVLRGFTVSPPGTKRRRWRVSIEELLRYESGEVPPAPTPRRSRRRQRLAAPAGPF
jgi:hypothetical protein